MADADQAAAGASGAVAGQAASTRIYPSSIFAIASASFGTTIGRLPSFASIFLPSGSLQFARCDSDRCNPDLSEHFPSEPRPRLRPPDRPGLGQLANSRQRGGRRGFASDAALSDHGFGVGDFLLAHVLHVPLVTVTSCSALGHETGSPMRMAVASVSRIDERVGIRPSSS